MRDTNGLLLLPKTNSSLEQLNDKEGSLTCLCNFYLDNFRDDNCKEDSESQKYYSTTEKEVTSFSYIHFH